MKKSSTLQILGRTVVILCAALIIVGAMLGLSQTGVIAGSGQAGGPPAQITASQTSDSVADVADVSAENTTTERAEFGHHQLSRGFNLAGSGALLKSAVPMALIILVVAGGNRLWQALRPRKLVAA